MVCSYDAAERPFRELEHEIQYYSEHTREQYRFHISDYLDFVKKKYGNLENWKERDVVYAYIDHLKKAKKLSQNTINYTIRGPIGCLFRMSGLRLPVKLPKVGSPVLDIANRISYTEEEIYQLIKAAQMSHNPQWQNMMALSSIYGLRAGEIRSLQKEDVHPLKKTILIPGCIDVVNASHLCYVDTAGIY